MGIKYLRLKNEHLIIVTIILELRYRSYQYY